MLLNIHTIFENILKENYNLVTENEIRPDLKGVRIFKDSMKSLSENILYIINAGQLKRLSYGKHMHFVCLGAFSYPSPLELNQSIIFIPENSNILEILTQIQEVFDQYRQWNDEIQHAILQEQPLQDIFDKCSILLKNPVALFDTQQNLLLKSGALVPDSEDSLWNFVLKNGYSPKEDESEILNKQFLTNPLPFFFNSTNKYKNINRLIARIQFNETLFGCLAMTDTNAPFTNMEYCNMCYLQDIMHTVLLHSKEYKSFKDKTPWYIVKLIKGSLVDKTIIEYNYSLKQKKLKDKFFLWTFLLIDNNNENVSIHHLLPNFQRFFKSEFVFIYENQIAVIEYQIDNYDNKTYLKDLQHFLKVNNFKGSYSMVFNNIFDLHNAFMQCQTALDTAGGSDELIFSFKDNYSSYLLNSLTTSNDLDSFLYPNIRNLLQKKDNYGLDLLNCLKTYIINGKNVSMTAEKLYVHRHTVIYRLNTISEILDIDLKTLNEDSLFQLYLSCILLLRSEVNSSK